jgi:hypothetical protein
MHYLLHFNSPDKPANMGHSQKTDNLAKFCGERSDMLPNWEIESGGKKLTFDITGENPNFDPITADVSGVDENGNTKTLTRRGYAIIIEVEDTFEN